MTPHPWIFAAAVLLAAWLIFNQGYKWIKGSDDPIASKIPIADLPNEPLIDTGDCAWVTSIKRKSMRHIAKPDNGHPICGMRLQPPGLTDNLELDQCGKCLEIHQRRKRKAA